MKEEEVFQLLGHITIYFATLDFLTTILIYDLLTDDCKKNNSTLRDNSTLKHKFVFLKNLNNSDIKSKTILEKINEFIDEAIAVSEERNRFIHDQWVFEESHLIKNNIRKMQICGIKGWEFEIKENIYSIEDIYGLLHRIGYLQQAIGSLSFELKTI